MFLDTIKFHEACIGKDLKTLSNLLKDKEKIDVKRLDQMKTLLRFLGPVRVFSSLKKLQEEMEHDPGEEVVRALCEIGVDLEQKYDNGQTALYLACRGNKVTNFGSVLKFIDNPRIVKILLEHGASVHAKDGFGYTPLHEACWIGNFNVMQTVIKHEVNVHAIDDVRGTPLHEACLARHLEVVQVLLKYKPNINGVYKLGGMIEMTPLMCAAIQGHFEIVEELLQHGADINFRDPDYGAALHLAIEYKHEQTVKILLKHGCKTNVQAKWTMYGEELPMCSAFELALNMKSINIVKTIAYHKN